MSLNKYVNTIIGHKPRCLLRRNLLSQENVTTGP